MTEGSQDLWDFMQSRNKLWLAPVILALLVARYIALLMDEEGEDS